MLGEVSVPSFALSKSRQTPPDGALLEAVPVNGHEEMQGVSTRSHDRRSTLMKGCVPGLKRGGKGEEGVCAFDWQSYWNKLTAGEVQLVLSRMPK